MDLEKAIGKIAELAQVAGRALPTEIKLSGLGPDEYAIAFPGEKDVDIRYKPTPPRRHLAFDLDAFERIVNDLTSEDKPGRVYIGRGEIVCVLDHGDHRLHRITMKMPMHESFVVLANASNAHGKDWLGEAIEERDDSAEVLAGMTQKQMDWLLRTQFTDVTPASFAPLVRKVRAVRGANIASETQHGRASVDRDIQAEVRGADGQEIPSEVTIEVPVLMEHLFPEAMIPRARVRCAVRLNLDDVTFTLRPQPGLCEIAIGEAVDAIEQRLKQQLPHCVVYGYGWPE